MTNSRINHDSDLLIARQWDCNAQSRFEELNTGQDKTYKNVLCPELHNLLEKLSPGRSVIDVGCGLGFFSDYIHMRGFEVTGVDMSSKCISIARDKFPSLKFHNENIIDFSQEKHGQFAACVANMLFHNVPNVEEVAAAIFGLLKPKGVLVGCIPHPEYWFDRRRNKAKRVSMSGGYAYLTPFQIKGSDVHPAPFTYFQRKCDNYLRIFIQVGFSEVRAVSFENKAGIPDDLVFFIAKK
jgi:2-polyprenyl-3-methyl-5-hydroxy-6-metoxy-1,4-benzoquinol methylase